MTPTRPQLVGINHVALEVDALERALAFWRAVFGEIEVDQRANREYTVQIVSADFNGDGNPDLATANRGTFPADQNGPPFTSSVSVLLGDGTGHFPTTNSVPMGAGPAAKARRGSRPATSTATAVRTSRRRISLRTRPGFS